MRDFGQRSRSGGKAIAEHCRTHELHIRPRTGGESATTVQVGRSAANERADIAPRKTRCCVHVAKPNRIRLADQLARSSMGEKPGHDHQRNQRDQDQRDVRPRHPGYLGA
ncbi:hypothetical protein [Mycobacterium tuberculosis]|uniref:hypothetical protein n=1 Tax=Mycobacterium tuberculosis TaxID=1773 RepID=UPI0006DCE3E7|nr:hypothetical protein [Mycobacterium tuberculosis]